MRFLFTGDLALVGSAYAGPEHDYELTISNEIKDLFRTNDYSIINLESPLTDSNSKIIKTGPHLKSSRQSVKVLNDLGVKIACLSNNHIRDFGDQGVLNTINTCQANNILTVGAGKNSDEASLPLIVNGNNKRIAFLNFSEEEFNTAGKNRAGSNPDDEVHIWRSIENLKNQVDLLIVVMHGGKEMYPYPTPRQLKLYRFIIDIGADLVVGHHTHVFGGHEIYKQKPIIYSLGNFIFDEEGNHTSWYYGMLAEISYDFQKGKLDKLVFYKTLLANKQITIEEKIIPDEGVFNGSLFVVDENEVARKWESLITSTADKTMRVLLNPGILKRIRFKLWKGKLSSKEKASLLRLSNMIRCRTHRELNNDILNMIQK